MSSLLKRTIVFFALAIILLLSACVPAQPTQNPQDVQNEVATAVALTIAAQNAQTQAAQALLPAPTNTMLPTQTEAAPLDTATPLPTDTPIVLPTQAPASSGGGGGGTVVKKDLACNPFPRKPRDNEIFRPGDEFDIKWTIVNTGTKTMQKGLDVKFNDGTKMTSTNIVELPELKPGDSYVVDLDAVAPDKEGTYIMTFIVEGGLCYPYTAIIVEK